jgi:hypothetical protein
LTVYASKPVKGRKIPDGVTIKEKGQLRKQVVFYLATKTHSSDIAEIVERLVKRTKTT